MQLMHNPVCVYRELNLVKHYTQNQLNIKKGAQYTAYKGGPSMFSVFDICFISMLETR